MTTLISEENKDYSTKAILQSAIAKDRESEFESVKRHLNWLREDVKLVEAMPPLPKLPLNSRVGTSIGNIYFYLPRSQDLINTLKSLDWEGYGFKLRRETDNSSIDGSYYISYEYVDQSWNTVQFSFDAKMEGASCVLTKIGEETRTTIVPIYEVTCPEGAMEDVWHD